MQGKYTVSVDVKGAVRVKFSSLKGTLIVKLLFADSLARKVKERQEGEETIFSYWGSAVFQK